MPESCAHVAPGARKRTRRSHRRACRSLTTAATTGSFGSTRSVRACAPSRPDVLEAHSPYLGMAAVAGLRAHARRCGPPSGTPTTWARTSSPRSGPVVRPAVARRVSAPLWQGMRALARAVRRDLRGGQACRPPGCAPPASGTSSTCRSGSTRARFARERDGARRAAGSSWAMPREGTAAHVGVGRFAIEKRWDVVLDAFARIRARHAAVLVLFGDGPERARSNVEPLRGVRFAGFDKDRARLGRSLASRRPARAWLPVRDVRPRGRRGGRVRSARSSSPTPAGRPRAHGPVVRPRSTRSLDADGVRGRHRAAPRPRPRRAPRPPLAPRPRASRPSTVTSPRSSRRYDDLLHERASPAMPVHVSIHDVSPAWTDEVEAALALCAAAGVRPALLVVPNFHGRAPLLDDARFCARLRELQAAGHEIYLHGFFHRSGERYESGATAGTRLGWLFAQRVVSGGEAEMSDVSAAEGRAPHRGRRARPARRGPPRGRLRRAGVVDAAVALAAHSASAGAASRRTTSGSTTPRRGEPARAWSSTGPRARRGACCRRSPGAASAKPARARRPGPHRHPPGRHALPARPGRDRADARLGPRRHGRARRRSLRLSSVRVRCGLREDLGDDRRLRVRPAGAR